MIKMKTAGTALFLAALASVLGGCGIAAPPIKNPPKVVATPVSGDLSVTTQAAPAVGGVTPVFISIANGTQTARAVVPSQVFAIDPAGERVAPIPPPEAARRAGGAGELKAALTSAAVSGAAEGAFGAAVGAIAGAATGGVARGAALGGGIGGGWGAITGAPAGQHEARHQATTQLSALALHHGDVASDFTVSGYVFFPSGNYSGVELLLINAENGNTEVVKAPWH